MPEENDKLWTFDRFAPGQDFGTIDIQMDEGRRTNWARVFGPSTGRLPRGMLVTAMMEAYIAAIQPRPDGNVHASQQLSFRPSSAQWGDRVSVTVSCADKEVRKGRNWVRFGITARSGGEVVMTGTIRSIWAA
ncbi:hypothetical protein FIU94_19585 (plasmid) [Sulfitobacter sp. THAF37]|uniref:hypothetical protein n=1 Tax=Sulfitobacter sp. THAF37 TaxID=2587855 RepID=UPI00126967CF|nr:hypothetical protein [Sulfitobacter sp. THAF37]QFT61041.1 hypothetical protein FIU94_19585 [Sulfitobacter sp. THAF37]